MYDLFKISLRATRDYVGNRIQSGMNRETYVSTMDYIHTRAKTSWTDFPENIKRDRTKAFLDAHALRYYILYNPRKYRLMAYDHALDILESLTLRFGGFPPINNKILLLDSEVESFN